MTYDEAKTILANSTRFYNHDDIMYVMNGGELKSNQQGYTIAPYGNVKGREVYPAEIY